MKQALLVVVILLSVGNPTVALTEQQKLLASDSAPRRAFGRSVAVNGDTLVIGASRSAYVFGRAAGGSWTEQQTLLAWDQVSDSVFGHTVVVEGDTVVVGDYYNNDNGIGSGAVYVFTREADGSWSGQQKLLPAGGSAFDNFGRSIALEGDTMIVGGPGFDHQGGAVWVFTRQSDGWWTERQFIEGQVKGGSCPFDPCNAPGPGYFGASVIIDGETALVGAPFEDDNGGAAYMFKRDAGGLWTEYQRLFAAEGEGIDVVGSAVGLDGDTAMLGAFQDDLTAGAAYVFTPDGAGVWAERQQLVASDRTEETRFAISLALQGDTAVFGSSTGTAYVFTRDAGGVWTERRQLLASDSTLGPVVAMEGETVVVGASYDPDDRDSPGAAYVFVLPRTVAIDVQPGGLANGINPRANGVIPLAILGDDGFDVTTIDVATLRFGPGQAQPAHRLHDWFTHAEHLRDVNLDGRVDLVAHFRTQDSGVACGDEQVTLSGQTLRGQALEGSDSIRTVGCGFRRGKRDERWRRLVEPE